METLAFLARAVVTGLACAFVVVWFHPELLRPVPPRTAVVQDAPTATRPQSWSSAVQAAAPAVVNVYTRKRVPPEAARDREEAKLREFFGLPPELPRARTAHSLGSGVVVSLDGYILTNHHVVRDAESIEVALRDGRSAAARLVGSDRETDLAVLQVGLPRVPFITIGRAEGVEVGDVVLAIGNPYGVGQIVTQGIVSATGRNRMGIATFENFIQTDAAINPGNSGGALVNARGELVGISTAILDPAVAQGIGFAIPANLAIDVLHQLVSNGAVARGWIGIEARDLAAEDATWLGLPAGMGVLVQGVLAGGPADLAGLLPGDLLTAVREHPVNDSRSAVERISAMPPGTRVPLTLLREGRFIVVEATVAQRPAAAAP